MHEFLLLTPFTLFILNFYYCSSRKARDNEIIRNEKNRTNVFNETLDIMKARNRIYTKRE